MDINEIRRINMRTLANELGSVVALATKLGKDYGQVSQWVNGSINSGTGKPRGMRADTCREIEEVTGKPRNWLDTDHSGNDGDYISLPYLDVQSSAGNGKFVDESMPVIRNFQVLADWALMTFGRNAQDRIRIIDNVGDSMIPTIQDQDILFVDITQNYFIADGIYIISWNGRLLTKRLRALADGRLAITSDNKIYKEEYVDAENIESLVICGSVKRWWTLRDR